MFGPKVEEVRSSNINFSIIRLNSSGLSVSIDRKALLAAADLLPVPIEVPSVEEDPPTWSRAALEQMAENLATMASKQEDVGPVASRKPTLRKPTSPTLIKANPKAVGSQRVSFAAQPAYPALDAGVVKAALQAGVESNVLEQMNKLVQRNPKAAKMGDLTPKQAATDPFRKRRTGWRNREMALRKMLGVRSRPHW